MLCAEPQLWPLPKEILLYGRKYAPFHLGQVHMRMNADLYTIRINLSRAYEKFIENLALLSKNTQRNVEYINKFIILIILEDGETSKHTLNVDESYSLSIGPESLNIVARIEAKNFFGARHGLETLSQLIWFDDVDETLNVLYDLKIKDEPTFPYRGLMVDTARNYFPVDLLKKVIDGMAANKLNVFHWHLTDSQSFPFVARSYPNMAKYGAYGPDMVYTFQDIQYIVEYAEMYGIRVLIEIDAPSHVLSGWMDLNSSQPLIYADMEDINGSLNLNNPEVLSILEKLYRDIIALTGDEIFHIGADETHLKGTVTLNKLISTLTKANDDKPVRNVIIWNDILKSKGTVENYTNTSVIAQHWLGSLDMIQISNMKVIFSSVETWYLDCGFGAWQEGKSPNCDPYRTWQVMYTAKPWSRMANMKQVLGGEVCMWTEQVGPESLETRIWPRAAAFAERVWSNPVIGFLDYIPSQVYTRLDTQRERMRSRNLKSEVLWPKYCTLNPGIC